MRGKRIRSAQVPWPRPWISHVLIVLGFLLQWPTLATLAMFPVLVIMYVRLARTEEQEALAQFGDRYQQYMREVLAFFPKLGVVARRPTKGFEKHT